MISRSLGWLAVCAMAAGCEPTQGPRNASFEASCGSCSTGIPTAAEWEPFKTFSGGGVYVGPSQRSGTGFVPTDGTYFIAFPADVPGGAASTAGIRQDDVDLSSTTALLFDYEAVGTVQRLDGIDGTVTVEILFTAMGTTTLWSKTYPVGTVNEQVRDATAMVDKPPTAGRLTIQVTFVAAPGFEFRIDNLRVR